MSSFISYEGTSDFIAATPALIITLAASGSITAGRGVIHDASNPASIYMPSGKDSGSVSPVGVCLATVSDGDPAPILVWGYAKSLPALPTNRSFSFGQPLVITGSGYWTTSGSTWNSCVAGSVVTGSAGYIFALINCMKPVVGAFDDA